MRALLRYWSGVQSVRRYRQFQNNESRLVAVDVPESPSEYVKHFERYATSVVSIIAVGRRVESSKDPIITEVIAGMHLAADLNVPGKTFPRLMETFPIPARFPTAMAPWKRGLGGKRGGHFFFALADEAAGKEGHDDSFAKHLFSEQEKLNLAVNEISSLTGNLFGADADTSSSILITFVLACCAFPETLGLAWEELEQYRGETQYRMSTFYRRNDRALARYGDEKQWGRGDLRKIKCDRQQPSCSSCAKTAALCEYPGGRGRAPKRPRRAVEDHVADRLSRLEALIRHLGQQSDASSLSAQKPQPGDSQARPPDAFPSDAPAMDASFDDRFSRLMIKETRSYFVSNVLWGNLADEVEELRDMLVEPDSGDDDFDSKSAPDPNGTAASGLNAALFGYRAVANSLQPFHPPFSQAVALYQVFTENVGPVIRVFHTPTLDRIYWDAIASSDPPDKNTEALLLVIYYSAIISIGEDECQHILGLTRAQAEERYRFAVEQSLARARLLQTQSLMLLQAAVVFIMALRTEDDTRTAWSLTALVYHLAQALGVHRDGTLFGLKPFETEMRRRLWWHICFLDNRSSEYHGHEPIVAPCAFDTKPPLNINDADLTPEMAEFPAERQGWTDMTFCVVRAEASKTQWDIGRKPPGVLRTPGSKTETGISVEEGEAIVRGLEQRLEEKYLRHCDPTVPFQLLTKLPAKCIIRRYNMMLHYPRGRKGGSGSVAVEVRDRLFQDSIEMLELTNRILTNPALARWHWHGKSWVPWHAVAFVLSELGSRPPSADCDRAWEQVQTTCNFDGQKAQSRRGNMWRPIRRMMAKARYVREMQATDPRSRARYNVPSWGPSSSMSTQNTPEYPTPSTNTSAASLDDSEWECNLFPGQDGTDPMDAFLGIEPDNTTEEGSYSGLDLEGKEITSGLGLW